MKNLTICLFGSSTMEGVLDMPDPRERWHEIMRLRLATAFPDTCFSIINSAIGGESTREIMLRWDRDVAARSPDILLIMVGGNNTDYTRPERLVPLDEVRAHLDDMAARIPAGARPVGVVFSPLISEKHWSHNHPAYAEVFARIGGGHDKLIEPQRELYRAFLRERGWPSLDLCELFGSDPARFLLPDGVHHNRTGHALFGNAMADLLETLLRG